MKILFISDTHGKHSELVLPEADILIHCGDFSNRGTQEEVEDFLNWYADLEHPVKIFIAGNHDFLAEQEPELFRKMIPENLIYLENDMIEIHRIKIWGSPIQPWFYDWAFNRQRGEEIRKCWEEIPTSTDILVTHGPPYSILDRIHKGQPVGCRDLLSKVMEIQPRIHAFGHIHEAYGQMHDKHTHFINASSANRQYEMVNPPVKVEWAG